MEQLADRTQRPQAGVLQEVEPARQVSTQQVATVEEESAETEPAEVPTAGKQRSEREPLEPEYDHRSDKITMVKAIVGSLCVNQEDGWRCKVSSCTGDFHRLKDCPQFGRMDPKDRMALVECLML
ncbi:MAG: hypothetical protein ACK559_08285, partial [bacterium]